jgi:nicotinate-nucleotide adenylyltransferase
MKRIGIMGGSFDPIHTGHAIIARHMLEQCGLDQLWLMVSPENPFKSGHRMASELHRLRMTELVSRRIAGVTTSGFEMSLPRPSYTIDTLRALRERFPDDEFALVIGADNWAAWDRWKNGDEILAHHHVYVYPRLGSEVVIPPALSSRVTLVAAPIIELSSTQVRQRASAGQDIDFLVPDAVSAYILKHNLYRDNEQQ